MSVWYEKQRLWGGAGSALEFGLAGRWPNENLRDSPLSIYILVSIPQMVTRSQNVVEHPTGCWKPTPLGGAFPSLSHEPVPWETRG